MLGINRQHSGLAGWGSLLIGVALAAMPAYSQDDDEIVEIDGRDWPLVTGDAAAC